MKSMTLKWRGGEYQFSPRILSGGPDVYNRNSTIDCPIFGSDTESVQLEDRYEPQCLILSGPDERDRLEYLPFHSFGLLHYLEMKLNHYEDLLVESGTVFSYWHNLSYDWLELIKTNELLLEMTRIGVSPSEDVDLFRLGGYHVTMGKDGLFVGNAPHFTIRMKRGKRSFRILFRDTFSFFPTSLSKASKDLGLPSKMERQLNLGMIDYRQDGAFDPEDKIYFEEYALTDARNTRLIAEKIREIHRAEKMTKIRASAPGFAIANVLQGMGEEREIKTGIWDAEIMQLILDTYRGGRTGGIYHGPVSNLYVYDFNSSYPSSMTFLPSFNPDMAYFVLENASVEDVTELLADTGNIFLRISGYESDPRYPALTTTVKGKLTPVYGAFENIATTGIEMKVGIESGTLRVDAIHEAVLIFDPNDDTFLPFKFFAENNFQLKKVNKKGTVVYIASKLKLNAAYGKLIESRNQTLLSSSDEALFLPFLPDYEKEFGQYYYAEYLKCIAKGSSLFDDYENVVEKVYEIFGDAIHYEQMAFGDFTLSGRIYGRYVVPAAASLITAYSRARLIAVAKASGGIYWDTDSVFALDVPPELMEMYCARIAHWFPKNCKPPALGDGLGDLDCEVIDGIGYLAGVKRYYLEYENEKGKHEIKAATHGIPALEAIRAGDAISALATGENFDYQSKPRPLKSKEAKRPEDIGSFQAGNYVSRFELDSRLSWERMGRHWRGSVKPYAEMIENTNTDSRSQMASNQMSFELVYP